jgi:hypothetical protein
MIDFLSSNICIKMHMTNLEFENVIVYIHVRGHDSP